MEYLFVNIEYTLIRLIWSVSMRHVQPLKIHFAARTICRSRHSELAGTIWFAGMIHFPIATTHEIDFFSFFVKTNCYKKIEFVLLICTLVAFRHFGGQI